MIDQALAAFLEEGLILYLGTRSARLEPYGTRVAALRVDPDGRHVTAYVPKVAATQPIANLSDNGQAALVAVRPLDERGCQIKGTFVDARPAGRSDKAVVLAQWEHARQTLERIGVARALTDAWVVWPAIAVRVQVTALFNQTPGPGAGAPLS